MMNISTVSAQAAACLGIDPREHINCNYSLYIDPAHNRFIIFDRAGRVIKTGCFDTDTENNV